MTTIQDVSEKLDDMTHRETVEFVKALFDFNLELTNTVSNCLETVDALQEALNDLYDGETYSVDTTAPQKTLEKNSKELIKLTVRK